MNQKIIIGVCAVAAAIVLILVFFKNTQSYKLTSHFELNTETVMNTPNELTVKVSWGAINPTPYMISIQSSPVVKSFSGLTSGGGGKYDFKLNSNTTPQEPMINVRVYAVDRFDNIYAMEDAKLPNPFYKKKAPIEFDYDIIEYDGCSAELNTKSF